MSSGGGLLLVSALLLFSVNAYGEGDGGIEVKLVEFPRAFSSSAAAAFEFEILDNGSGKTCGACRVECKLDDRAAASCQSGRVNYGGLPDGRHIFEVCAEGSRGLRCAGYNWTVDTTPPTASLSAISPFTSAVNATINISFSEPCTGRGGFQCSASDCNLLVYGSGKVLRSSLKVLQPDLKYSLVIQIPVDAAYGRLVIAMDKNFCSDKAGNLFRRTENSVYILRYDRRIVLADVRTRIPQRLIPINNVPRTVEATNDAEDLRVYVNFSSPVMNSSADILRALRTSSGVLIPIANRSVGNRRFTFMITNVSKIDVITLSLEAASIISRQGTPASPTEPLAFLYDSVKPAVVLSTLSATRRTRDDSFPVLVKFVKAVFGFNSSSLEISGGTLRSFREISRSVYVAEVHADEEIVSLKVLDSKAVDVAGNQNSASNILSVRHYSTPLISSISSGAITVVYWGTCMIAAVLAVSTARLLSIGFLPLQSSYFISEPTRNLVRIAFHIQVFAQSRWMGMALPIEFYEFTRGLQWSIPYLRLPWEKRSVLGDAGFSAGAYSVVSRAGMTPADELLYGAPLMAMEYSSFFENQGMKPEATTVLSSRTHDEWREFGMNMFWLAVIGGGLLALHAVALLVLKIRRKNSAGENKYGALTFPRFELFLAFLALPCISQASTSIIIRGHSVWSTASGVVLLVVVGAAAAALLVFVTVGISMGRILEYKEVHQVVQKFHWLQEIIRVSLGPGKRGQWTWKKQADSPWLTKMGPVFEDIRGPPKYMLSQFAAGSRRRRGGALIDSDDETEDAEAPCMQKLFGILRIYYPLLETLKRVAVGAAAGAVAGARSRRPSRGLILVCLSATSIQLFFMVLKKPFIKKLTQLVEILAVAAEVVVFGCCLALLRREDVVVFSGAGERRVGTSIVALIAAVFCAQMIAAWYALWKQVQRLSTDGDAFFPGLRTAALGLLLFVLPSSACMKGMAVRPPTSSPTTAETGGAAGARGRSSSSQGGERPWLRQLREMAKASFSRDEVGSSAAAATPASTSQNLWGGLWGGKRSGSSSFTSSLDAKARPKALDKDLEVIFSSR